MDIKVTKKLHKVLKDSKYLRKQFTTSLGRIKNKGLREYKLEIPVDKGIARNSVVATKQGLGFIITTTATNQGRPYPLFVHEGTYDFKGAKDYGRRSSRLQFSYTDSGNGAKGIRPNKFADRARETTYEWGNKELAKFAIKLATEF